jgi:hypothetical protein
MKKICEICRKVFHTPNELQKQCGDPDCKKKFRSKYMKGWYKRRKEADAALIKATSKMKGELARIIKKKKPKVASLKDVMPPVGTPIYISSSDGKWEKMKKFIEINEEVGLMSPLMENIRKLMDAIEKQV